MQKTIIVTGAGGNLGEATINKLLQEGHTVIGTVSSGKKLDYLKNNPTGEVHSIDLTNEHAAAQFIDDVLQRHASIDAVLLLVGGFAMGGIEDTSGEVLKKMYSLNFETAYFVVKPVFKQMLKQRNGRIIFIGARPALDANDGKGKLAYALSKSLLFKLSEFLNEEGRTSNVLSTVIVPSLIDTPENRKAMPNSDYSMWVRAEEIAETMESIASGKITPSAHDIKMYGKA